MKFLINIIVFSTLAFMTNANAADLKIGHVEVERLLREAPQVEEINAKMLDRFGSQKTELDTAEKEIQELQGNYKRNELVMTEDKLNELKNGIISKVQIFKQKQAVLQQEVATMRSQEVAVLQETIRGVIDEIAKGGKYDLIVGEGVLHSSEKYKITDKVLEKMRALVKK